MGFFDELKKDLDIGDENKDQPKTEIRCPRCDNYPTIGDFKCETCGKTWSSKNKIKYKNEHEPRIFCPQCNEPPVRGEFECEDCGFVWEEKLFDKEKAECFIATATFGSPTHPKIDSLRNFRDKKLRRNLLGKCLIETYYKISPPIAEIISNSPNLKRISKSLLVKPAIHLAKRVL